ncbi:MAG: hypothetical protein KF778_18390 [Rhodocyclaceae bacterium]|nr:hypothetical protein [Rhodocyclaceae bacterium]MBX3670375.1 hypothetical protein [Rhodocyclaceae bacterium]
MSALEIIVQAEAEGGMWTLYGRRGHGDWQFQADLDDHTVTPLLGKPVHKAGGMLGDWEAALAAYDHEAWFRFKPVLVHAEFRDRIWHAFTLRDERYGGGAENAWRSACAA